EVEPQAVASLQIVLEIDQALAEPRQLQPLLTALVGGPEGLRRLAVRGLVLEELLEQLRGTVQRLQVLESDLCGLEAQRAHRLHVELELRAAHEQIEGLLMVPRAAPGLREASQRPEVHLVELDHLAQQPLPEGSVAEPVTELLGASVHAEALLVVEGQA